MSGRALITMKDVRAAVERGDVGPNSPLLAIAKGARKKRDNPEERAQVALIAEIKRVYPPPHPISRIYAIPNDDIGMRTRKQAQRAQGRKKAMGLSAGMLDLCLPVARAGWFGLYIELKIYPNKLTEKQIARVRELESDGYHVVVIREKTPDNVVALAMGYIVSYESMVPTHARKSALPVRSAAEKYCGI